MWGPSEGESDTDTLMIVHVPAGRRSVQVVSLPRDSWVSIPGHGMNKINAALGIGGPRLMVQTVEQDTGVTINDYVSVNFLWFLTRASFSSSTPANVSPVIISPAGSIGCWRSVERKCRNALKFSRASPKGSMRA